MDQKIVGGLYKAAGIVSIGVGIYLLGKGHVISEAAEFIKSRPDIIIDAVFEVMEEGVE